MTQEEQLEAGRKLIAKMREVKKEGDKVLKKGDTHASTMPTLRSYQSRHC